MGGGPSSPVKQPLLSTTVVVHHDQRGIGAARTERDVRARVRGHVDEDALIVSQSATHQKYPLATSWCRVR